VLSSNATSRTSSASASISVEEDAAEVTSAAMVARAAFAQLNIEECSTSCRFIRPHIVAIE